MNVEIISNDYPEKPSSIYLYIFGYLRLLKMIMLVRDGMMIYTWKVKQKVHVMEVNHLYDGLKGKLRRCMV